MVLALCLLLLPRGASSQPRDAAETAAAARAFRAGQKAQLLGRYEEAAEKYELADELIPTTEALRSALRARLAAGNLTMAAAHAQSLLRRCEARSCRAYPVSVLKDLRRKLTRVSLACLKPCRVAVNGRPLLGKVSKRHRFYVRPGRSEVVAIFESSSVVLAVTGVAGQRVSVAADAPPVETPPVATEARPVEPPPPQVVLPNVVPKAPPPAAELAAASPATIEVVKQESGLSPVVPLVGYGIAVGLGVAAGWSISDARSAHDAYSAAPTEAGWDDGRSKDLRSNVLLYSAIGTVAISSLVAALWTNW